MKPRHFRFWPQGVPGTINIIKLKCRVDFLAGFLQEPRSIEFTDNLPKSGTGKVQWRLLQKRQDSNNERKQDR